VIQKLADAVLLRYRGPLAAPDRLVAAMAAAAGAHGLPAAAVTVNIGLDGDERYVYLWLRETTEVEPASLAQVIARASGGAAVDATRFACLQDIRGASHGATTEFHYVVETDVAPEAEGDLNEWYNNEHLPGLAAVPGAIRARRLLNLDRGPRYHSCYELVTKETLAAAPWLAVRHTEWSDRIRPSFRNTKRTMFRRVAELTLPTAGPLASGAATLNRSGSSSRHRR